MAKAGGAVTLGERMSQQTRVFVMQKTAWGEEDRNHRELRLVGSSGRTCQYLGVEYMVASLPPGNVAC